MNVLARKDFFKKRHAAEQAQKRKEDEHQAQALVKAHLRAAAQAIGVTGKWKEPLNAEWLSYSEKLSLLERYADRLTEEIQVFQQKYGSAGGRAVSRLTAERDSVLVSLATTRIQQLKEDLEPRRKVEL